MDIYIEIFGRGDECYFKFFNNKETSAKTVENDYKDDYWKLDEDQSEMILDLEEATLLVEIDGEEHYEGPLKESGVNFHQVGNNNSSIKSLIDAGNDDLILFWGHDGMVNFSITVVPEDDFEMNLINVYVSQAPDHERLPNAKMILGLDYNEVENEDEEDWFDPKMGYWGPYVVK